MEPVGEAGDVRLSCFIHIAHLSAFFFFQSGLTSRIGARLGAGGVPEPGEIRRVGGGGGRV